MSDSPPPAGPLETRRRRLVYRACHRGTKEMDLILGGYVRRHIAAMGEKELDELERIVALSDEVWDGWLKRETDVPPEYDTKLVASILGFTYKPEDYT